MRLQLAQNTLDPKVGNIHTLQALGVFERRWDLEGLSRNLCMFRSTTVAATLGDLGRLGVCVGGYCGRRGSLSIYLSKHLASCKESNICICTSIRTHTYIYAYIHMYAHTRICLLVDDTCDLNGV